MVHFHVAFDLYKLANPARVTANTNSGAVGIGVSAPDPAFKLSIDGKVRAKEIKVQANWSDFVFEPGYYLPSLDEVARFINQNGHLRDIPSAAEVESNGVAIGEMHARLLQKIEELTLYVIELDKEGKALEEKIQRLQTK